MPPFIAPPPPDMLAQLLAEHAHRYPEKATVDAIGDGGEVLRLPLLLGNPTGTNKDPTGAPAFPAWENLVATNMGARTVSGITDAIVRDCLIYPGRGLLGQWETRWPAIVDSLGAVVLKKIGAEKAFIRSPLADEKPPDALALILKANQTAMWRWIDLGPEPIAVALVVPSKPHWDALTAALRRDGVDCVSHLDELITTCVKGDGVGARLQQWPGLALPLENLVVKMAGAGAEARLGEW